VIDIFEVTPSRANFLNPVVFLTEREINPSRKQNNVAAFANRLTEENHNHFTQGRP